MSQSGKDNIFVVVDRYSKIAHFVAYTKTNNATHTADLSFWEIVLLHDLPKIIVSDKMLSF